MGAPPAPRRTLPGTSDDGPSSSSGGGCPPPEHDATPLIIYASPDGHCTSPADAAAGAGPPGGPSAGRAALAALLDPLPLSAFWEAVFERRPLVIHRGGGGEAASATAGLFGVDNVRALLARGALRYGTGVDVVRFDGAVRHTFNTNVEAKAGGGGKPKRGTHAARAAPAANAPLTQTEDVADAGVVARRLEAGCSARILHPQRWAPRLAAVLAAVEGEVGSVVGANAYLTPAGAQGFAPHWDDIDAFVLQVDGRKRWRLYGARSADEVLPRHSSADLDPASLGPLLADIVLEPGDVLYMPRGTVHQAETPQGDGEGDEGAVILAGPSLHLTISICQQSTWADLLAVALPAALEAAAADDAELRASVPSGALLACAGVVHSDAGERAADAVDGGGEGGPDQALAAVYAHRAYQREKLAAALRRAADRVVACLSIDDAADAVGARFMLDRMNPGTGPSARRGKKRKTEAWNAGDAVLPACVVPAAEGSAARLVVEGDDAVLYHAMSNAAANHASGVVYEDAECRKLHLPLEAAPAVETLLGVHSATQGDAIDVGALMQAHGPGLHSVVGKLLELGVVVPAA